MEIIIIITLFLFYSSEDERPSGVHQQPSFSLNIDGDIAGLRKKKHKVNPVLMQSGMGSWEVHTKGIGAKLLLQVHMEYHLIIMCSYLSLCSYFRWALNLVKDWVNNCKV